MSYKLPRDGFDSVKLTPIQSVITKIVMGAQKIFRFWTYPLELDPEKITLIKGLYWLNKSRSPMRRARKGTNIENHFKQNLSKLNPNYLQGAIPIGFNPDTQVRISFVGDLMNARGIENSRDRFYTNVESQIFDVDISLANLESTLTKAEIEDTVFETENMPKINATMDQYRAVIGHKQKKFTAFHTANNHILDNGFEGFNTTHDQLEQDGFPYFGTNRTKESQSTGLIIEKKGIKIGLIGWTYGVNLRDFPPGHEYLVNSIPFHHLEESNDLSPIKTQIDNLKAKGVDFIIVSIHWGIEFEFYPTPKQMRQAYEICEMGADMIISHHTHCIQATEFYAPKRDSDRLIPIIYGLGNFTSVFSTPHSALSLISNFTISKGTVNGTAITFVDSLKLTPVFQREHISEEGNYLTAELLSEFRGKQLGEERFERDVELMVEYATQILGSGWK